MSTEIMPMSSNEINSNIIFSTITAQGIDAAITIANAVNNPDSLNDVNDVIAVVDILCTHGVRKGRNNLPDTPCVNTTLICKDGTALFSQSDGVARSASTIVTLFPDCGRSQGMEYLPLRVNEKMLNNGNTLKVLEIVR